MRYRRDRATAQADGATLYHTIWMGGPTLAAIKGCRVDGIETRYTVEITGEPDTYFSIPAYTRIKGRRVTGYVYVDNGDYRFRAYDVFAVGETD